MTGLVLALASLGCDKKAAADSQPTADKTTEVPAPDEPERPPAKSAAAAADEAPDEASGEAADKADDKADDKAEADEAKDDGNDPKAETKPTKVAAAKPEGNKAGADKNDEVKKGEDVAAPSFSTWLQSSGTYQTGKQGTVTAVLVPKSPYKCNAKYPYKFKVNGAGNGVTYPESTVRGMQVSPKRATMTIPFVPSKAGKTTVSGELSFSICTEERCVIEKRTLAVTVDVK